MEIRTDRVGILIEQLADALDLARQRCADLGDDEFMWELAGGMWSVRDSDAAVTSAAFGPGPWVLDRELINPFEPGPLSTIAWRFGHLLSGFAGRYEWTFGSREVDPANVVDFSPHAGDAVPELWDVVARWAAAVDKLTPEQLDETGFGQYPWGLDAELPFIGIVRWVNREFIHHTAEIALMRDLYAQLKR